MASSSSAPVDSSGALIQQTITLTPEEISQLPWTLFVEEWKGVSVDAGKSFKYQFEFADQNRRVVVTYSMQSPNCTENLQLDFDVEKVTKEDVKLTVWFKNGRGSLRRVLRGKETVINVQNEAMVCFITGIQMVFGIDLPPILIHELRLQRRILRTPCK